MVVEPPFLERHVLQGYDWAVIIRKGGGSDIEAPHAGMPDGW